MQMREYRCIILSKHNIETMHINYPFYDLWINEHGRWKLKEHYRLHFVCDEKAIC